MIQVKIPKNGSIFMSDSPLIDWMQDNVGTYYKEWGWLSDEPYSRSVWVKDPEKATLVALRWSGQ
jgi:hypothetical protein